MCRPIVLLLTALCAAVFSSGARAEIVWKQKTDELRADAHSASSVDITQLESSCGCTTVNLEKRHYEPRESGEVVARYTVGAQTGTQTKTILVVTNDGQAPTTLTLEIHLPEVVRLLPPAVNWKHGETPTPRVMTLEIVGDVPAKSVDVASSASGFDTQVNTLVAGRKYELAVRPASTEGRQFSRLTIRCRFGEQEKVYSAEAMVQAAATGD